MLHPEGKTSSFLLSDAIQPAVFPLPLHSNKSTCSNNQKQSARTEITETSAILAINRKSMGGKKLRVLLLASTRGKRANCFPWDQDGIM